MKKLVLLLAMTFLGTTPILRGDACSNPKPVCSSCNCKATGRTFFTVRPLFQPASPEMESLTYDKTDDRVDGYCGFMEAVLFGSRSTKPTNLGSYFMFDCKNQLLVNESNANTPEKDILATEFNISTVDGDFQSIISFAPRQSVWGVGLAYRQSFICCEDKEAWICISTPITHVSNTVGFCERIINDGGGLSTECATNAIPPVANMTEAFRQASWRFGRVDSCRKLTTTRLGDISVEVGYEYFKCPYAFAESFVGIVIPTGNEVRGCYLFEPIVGYNRHFGVSFGGNGGLELWDCDDYNLWAEFQFYGRFFFSHTEVRSFDLKNKPWSRYMKVYKNLDEAQLAANSTDACSFTPGINVFTQPMCVRPGFQRTINLSIYYTRCQLQLEAGYNLFCRPAECVKLKCGWQEGPALRALTGEGFTNDILNIAGGFSGEPVGIDALDRAVTNYALNVITFADLDLESAAHPTMISHTFYGTLGYRWDELEYPVFAGLGGSYEFTEDNTGINRWVLWGKVGFSF